MNLTEKTFHQLLIMMMIALLGFVFGKITKTGDSEEKFLSKLLLYFVNPLLIINSFNIEFDLTKFIGLVISIVLSFIVTGAMIVLSEIVFHKKTDFSPIQKVATVFTNCAFIGIPLITAVLGNDGVLYLMGFIVAFNVLLWTYGYFQMAGKTNFKNVVTNPNVISVVVGILLFVSPVKLPQVIQVPVSLVGSLNTAVSMILLGMLFASLKKEWIEKLIKTFASFFMKNCEEKNQLSRGRKKIGAVIFTTFVRLFLCGIVSGAVCLFSIFVIKKIGLGALSNVGINYDTIVLICSVVLIASLCPTGISVSSMAVLFDKDAVFSNFLVCFTHAVCLISIPLMLDLFLKFV